MKSYSSYTDNVEENGEPMDSKEEVLGRGEPKKGERKPRGTICVGEYMVIFFCSGSFCDSLSKTLRAVE